MLQIRYDPEWQPIELNLDATARNQAIALQISVNGTSATTRLTSGGQTTDNTHTIDPGGDFDAQSLFRAYEAVAARLRTASAGSVLPAPGRWHPCDASRRRLQEDRHSNRSRVTAARRTHVTFASPGVPEVEADALGRRERPAPQAQRARPGD